MQRLRERALGDVGLSLVEGAITGSLNHIDFGGDGDGDGDGDSVEVEITAANGASSDFPANAIPLEVIWYLDEEFAGGSIDGASITMGDTGNPDQISGESAINVFTGAGTGIKFATGENDATDGARVFEAAYTPVARLTTTTEPNASLTAGKIRYLIRYLRVDVG